MWRTPSVTFSEGPGGPVSHVVLLSRGPSLLRKDGVLSPWDVVLMLFVLPLCIEGHWDRCSHPS